MSDSCTLAVNNFSGETSVITINDQSVVLSSNIINIDCDKPISVKIGMKMAATLPACSAMFDQNIAYSTLSDSSSTFHLLCGKIDVVKSSDGNTFQLYIFDDTSFYNEIPLLCTRYRPKMYNKDINMPFIPQVPMVFNTPLGYLSFSGNPVPIDNGLFMEPVKYATDVNDATQFRLIPAPSTSTSTLPCAYYLQYFGTQSTNWNYLTTSNRAYDVGLFDFSNFPDNSNYLTQDNYTVTYPPSTFTSSSSPPSKDRFFIAQIENTTYKTLCLLSMNKGFFHGNSNLCNLLYISTDTDDNIYGLVCLTEIWGEYYLSEDNVLSVKPVYGTSLSPQHILKCPKDSAWMGIYTHSSLYDGGLDGYYFPLRFTVEIPVLTNPDISIFNDDVIDNYKVPTPLILTEAGKQYYNCGDPECITSLYQQVYGIGGGSDGVCNTSIDADHTLCGFVSGSNTTPLSCTPFTWQGPKTLVTASYASLCNGMWNLAKAGTSAENKTACINSIKNVCNSNNYESEDCMCAGTTSDLINSSWENPVTHLTYKQTLDNLRGKGVQLSDLSPLCWWPGCTGQNSLNRTPNIDCPTDILECVNVITKIVSNDNNSKITLNNTCQSIKPTGKTTPSFSYVDISGTVGVPISATPDIENASGDHTFKMDGELPDGLKLNSDTGVISGTPVNSQQTTEYKVIMDLNDGQTTVNGTINIAIQNQDAVKLTYKNINAVLGEYVSNIPTLENWPNIAKQFTIVNASIKEYGLSLDSASGEIYGTATKTMEKTTYTIQLVDSLTKASHSTTTSLQISISVAPKPPTNNHKPTRTNIIIWSIIGAVFIALCITLILVGIKRNQTQNRAFIRQNSA